MADVKLGGAKCVEICPAGCHELDGTVDFFGQRFVPCIGRVIGESAIPLVHRTKVCKTTLGECANQVQR